jgi:hypothetical protein
MDNNNSCRDSIMAIVEDFMGIKFVKKRCHSYNSFSFKHIPIAILLI